jgi:hypothetical protein
MIENYDGYNGWSNRETWATALHINNDQGLYETARDYTITAVEHHPATEDGSGQSEAIYCLADTLENFVTELLDTDWDGVKSMRYDIGSLYRVDWQEIADSFISEMMVK